MSTWKKFIVASDLHGDQQDAKAVRVLHKFTQSFKPDIKIFAGDLFDFRALRKKASEDEKRESMMQDYSDGVQFLKDWQPNHYLHGNHEVRLFDLAAADKGITSDYAKQVISELDTLCLKLKCTTRPYDKRLGIVQLGHLKVIHGFYAGITAARRTAQVYGSVLMGHGHAIDAAVIEGIEPRIGRMIGCLCKLDMEYNRALLGSLRHQHGFAFGLLAPTGDYFVYQAQCLSDRWLLPTEFLEL